MGTNVLPGEPRSGPERRFTMGAPATRPVLRTTPKNSPSSSSFSSSTCSPNLFKQIKSTLLFHLTFIWRATPPLSLCFLLFLCFSQPAAHSSFNIGAPSSVTQGPNKEKSVHFHNVSNYVLYLPFCGLIIHISCYSIKMSWL